MMKRRSHLHDGARGLQRHVATRLINILGSLARSWRGLTSHTHALWIPPHTNDINHTNHTNNEYPDFKQISWSHPSLGGAGGLPILSLARDDHHICPNNKYNPKYQMLCPNVICWAVSHKKKDLMCKCCLILPTGGLLLLFSFISYES